MCPWCNVYGFRSAAGGGNDFGDTCIAVASATGAEVGSAVEEADFC